MATTEPIKDAETIQQIKEYLMIKEDYRMFSLITMGFHSALRIGDILKFCWGDVYDFKNKLFKKYVTLKEQKTGKNAKVALHTNTIRALEMYMDSLPPITAERYIFKSQKSQNKPLSRIQAYRIMKKIETDLQIETNFSCHSLRKTFGYHAYKQGASIAVIMNIYNHSSFEITKRYLGISQDDKDELYLNINL